ncbi:MAG: hypothetical protein IJ094_11905 [Bacilli bacterium]|nr:hypothetical protein [Bacilli bacterium]
MLKSEGFDTFYNKMSRIKKGYSISKNWETFYKEVGSIRYIYNINSSIKGVHIRVEDIDDGNSVSNTHIINAF